jgi:SAM-dependent methyltransferase
LTTAAADRSRLLALIGSSWRTQAIYAMVLLGIADRLCQGDPVGLQELATEVGADQGALRRLLRGLRVLGLIRESDAGFALTPMGQLLNSGDGGESLADWVRWWAGDLQWRTWGALTEAVREGRPMRERFAPASGYEVHAASAGAAHVFHSAMAQLSAAVGPAVIACLRGAAACKVIDIGGGRGELLGQVLLARPETTGVLLEQNHALPTAREHLTQVGVIARCTVAQGDFFREVPAGADIYLLKSILHNWADAQAERLLRECRRAMKADARLAVIERAIDDDSPHEADVRADLNMLVGLGGLERTVNELHALFERCGLRACSVFDAGEYRIFLCRTGM